MSFFNYEKAISLLQATLESTTDGILVVEMWKIPESIRNSRDDAAALAFVL